MIDEHLARRLVAAQFPQWAHLPVVPVAVGGVDNRTFRLGDELTVRMPSAAGYAAQVAKEQRWLPHLAPRLPLPVPVPVAVGEPGPGYPHRWSVLRWIDGETAAAGRIDDPVVFARDVAAFLVALGGIGTAGGPAPGAHNFHRGGDLAVYADETDAAVERLGDRVDGDAARAVFARALAARWDGPPVWFHGDVALGNLLVRDGRLAAVIDFGCCGVGDPACDTVLAWTLFTGPARDAFRDALGVDDGTWARGRGWALWKALIVLADEPDDAGTRRVLGEVLGDGVPADGVPAGQAPT